MKWLISISFLLFSFSAKAHQADISSTMLVEQEDGKWILQIRAALTAFEYEINHHFGENAYNTPEKFQELVVSHLKENIVIHFNKNEIAVLNNIDVKLGHETNAIFEVLKAPKTLSNISVKNASFKNINRNQSALIIVKKEFDKEQFVLNQGNNHTANLKVHDNKFVLLSKSDRQSNSWNLYYIIAALIIGLLVFILVRKIILKH